MTGSVSTSAIKVHVQNGGKTIDFSAPASGVPSGASGPVPIIIGMGGSSLDASIVKGEGVATGTYDHQSMPSDPHDHCTFYAATKGEPLKRAIRAFLTKQAAPDGRIAPPPAGTADLTKWIPWTAPTLADDVSWPSPPLTSK